MHAIVVNEFGPPGVLVQAEVGRPSPGPSEVLVELSVAGVNFLDLNQRTGAPPLQPPFAAGVEGVGVIAEAGASVTHLGVGQRVGWLSGGQGVSLRPR
jgi:NADPH2:quinone reductase